MTQRKLQRGFNAFEKNTGFAHPSHTQQLSKRATGSDELTDDSGSLWQGTISVGSPAVEYTGMCHFLPSIPAE